jgi:hypothetical protein
MMLMAEKTEKSSHKLAGDRLIAIARKKSPAPEIEAALSSSPKEAKIPRTTIFQKLGKLKPLLPVISSGLRMVDHGAVQAIAQLLHFVDGSTAAQAAAHEDLEHGLAEVQASHRELSLQVQGQTVEVKRLEEQIVRLRQTLERNATDHAELAQDVKSLGTLVRTIGAGLGVLLIVLILLTLMLLAHRP